MEGLREGRKGLKERRKGLRGVGDILILLLIFLQFAHEDEFNRMVRDTVVVVQLIIEFVKRIPGFTKLPESDQVHLLKRSTSELMILRTARR